MNAESLINFFAQELDLDTESIAADTLLFSSGIIDSFALVSMMMFVESEVGIRIAPADVRLDNFDSIERILAFVEQAEKGKLKGSVTVDDRTREVLRSAARTLGTPSYVYFGGRVLDTIAALEDTLGHIFSISYAIKCNPNVALLREMRARMDHVDASSIGEVDRALSAGYKPQNITFSGPAKRAFEIDRAVQLGIGAIVCESKQQLAQVNDAARRFRTRASVLLRINPKRVPRNFALNMAGRASQFGVDEEDLGEVLGGLPQWEQLDFCGFHIYSGGNCLDSDAIAENFQMFADLFEKYSRAFDLRPGTLIFGSGFGIPYFDGEEALDLDELGPKIETVMSSLRTSERFAQTECILEMGRFLTGPHGYLLTQVVAEKHSRGTDIRMCDAGFNNHLSACGMMGTIIRRNWKIENLSANHRNSENYLLVGPLCASFDQLAAQLELPHTDVGDYLAVEASGAYGLTASPTRFISHPEPREYLVSDNSGDPPRDISEYLADSYIAEPHRDPDPDGSSAPGEG